MLGGPWHLVPIVVPHDLNHWKRRFAIVVRGPCARFFVAPNARVPPLVVARFGSVGSRLDIAVLFDPHELAIARSMLREPLDS